MGCRGAAHLATVVVLSGSTRVAEGVVSWVDRLRRSWSDAASFDLDVADDELGPVAGAMATIVPEPRSVTAPVGDNESHVIGEVVAHVVEVAAVSSHCLSLAVLRHCRRVRRELTAICVEGDLRVERLRCVDSVVRARTVSVVGKLVGCVLLAGATTVAVLVEAMIGRGVTLVRSGGPGPLVGLHQVKLRAVVAGDLVGIAVAPAISVHPEVAIRVLAWHAHEVESGDAATLVMAEVDVPLDRATEEVGLEVLGVAGVKPRCRRDVASAVRWDMVVSTTGASEACGDIVSVLLAIDFNRDGREATAAIAPLLALVQAKQVAQALSKHGLRRGRHHSGQEGFEHFVVLV